MKAKRRKLRDVAGIIKDRRGFNFLLTGRQRENDSRFSHCVRANSFNNTPFQIHLRLKSFLMTTAT
jgi:hypothetical protein